MDTNLVCLNQYGRYFVIIVRILVIMERIGAAVGCPTKYRKNEYSGYSFCIFKPALSVSVSCIDYTFSIFRACIVRLKMDLLIK
jgi:hypothetical protein